MKVTFPPFVDSLFPVILESDVAFPNPDCPLEVRELHQYFQPGRHCHKDFMELVLVTGGRAMHAVGNTSYPIGIGDLLIIPEGVFHQYYKIADLRYFNILFDPVKLELPLADFSSVPGASQLLGQNFKNNKQQSSFHLTAEDFEKTRLMAHNLHNTLVQKIPGMKFSAKAQLMMILDFLARCLVKSRQHIPPKDVTRLSILAQELELKYPQAWTIADMCKITKLSRPILFREFQKVFNTTPMDYLLSVRMRHAGMMLANNTKSISEIAIDCGFTDSSYFILRFRKRFGMTPRDFRLNTAEKLSSPTKEDFSPAGNQTE